MPRRLEAPMAERSSAPNDPEKAKARPAARKRAPRKPAEADALDAVPTEIPADQETTRRVPEAPEPEEPYAEYSLTEGEPEPEPSKGVPVFLPGVHERTTKPMRSALPKEQKTVKTVKRGAKLPASEAVQAAAAQEAARPVEAEMIDAYDSLGQAQARTEDLRQLRAWQKANPRLSPAEGDLRRGERDAREEASSRLYEARRKRETREASAREEQAAAGGFTARDEAWFKAGEEADAQAIAATRAELERGGSPAPRAVLESPKDIAAEVKKAETLLRQGDLDPRTFSLADYAYLLKERVRIDAELEHASWWQARKLRKELRQALTGGYGGASGSQGLDDYAKQVSDAQLGNGALRRNEAERAAPPKKPSFWERFRMGRGR